MEENVNIYDYIDEFYGQDPGWNELLPHRLVEGYAREKMWQGMPEERILEIWDSVMFLFLYLGNTEITLKNMRQEAFIDCLSWCKRNIADFDITSPAVEQFLDNLQDFYEYLYKKGFVSYPNLPEEVKEEIIQNGRVLMIKDNGFFTEAYARKHTYIAEDAPHRIFLNMGEKMLRTLNALQNYFDKNPDFKDDMHRARFFYENLVLAGTPRSQMSAKDYEISFWDYFLFDYHLLCGAGAPVCYALDKKIYEEEKCEQLSIAVLEELVQTKLRFFRVLGFENGQYKCKCVITDEVFYALMPILSIDDFDDVMFQGHIFYDQSMVVNFVKGLRMSIAERKKALQTLEKLRTWASVRFGCEIPLDMFIDNNPILARHAFLLTSGGVDRINEMPNSSYLDGSYQPEDILDEEEDQMTMLLDACMNRFLFSREDVVLAQTLWADFIAASGKQTMRIQNPANWMVAVVYVYAKVNEVFNYSLEHLIQPVQQIASIDSIRRNAAEIRKVLKIEPHDARYLSEEGLLMLFLRE